MIRPEDVLINIDEMKIIEMPRKIRSIMSVTINSQGYFIISPKLLKELKAMFPNLEVEIRSSEDARYLIFRKPECYQFSVFKTGRFKHDAFMMELKKMGYQLPAKYTVAWNPNLDAWVGVLQEIDSAPNLELLAKGDKPRRRGRRRKTGGESPDVGV